VVPALKEACPEILERLGQTQEHLRESRSLIDNYLTQLRSRISQAEGAVIRFDCDALRALRPLKAYLFELFRDYGFTDWRAVASLLEGETGREVRSASHRLLRDRGSLLLKQLEMPEQESYPVPLDERNPVLPIGLQIRKMRRIGVKAPRILYIDKETLKGGLLLRKWRKGDYFYPLGMRGRKLVSKYFKDAGMSRYEKEAQWLLCSGNDIVWVVGRRADDRFKVTGQTSEIIKITWED
jgi:tRNA(Ile)-lysidine synthase